MNIFKTFEDIKSHKIPVIIWSGGSDSVMKADLMLKTWRKELNEIDFDVSAESEYFVEQIITNGLIAQFYISDQGIQFTSEIKNFKNGILTIQIPKGLERIERRREMRIIKELQVTLNDGIQVEQGTSFDLSVGGCAVIINSAGKKFKKGSKYIISFYDKEISLSLHAKLVEFVNIRPFTISKFPYAKARASFKFLKLDDNDKKILNCFIKKFEMEGLNFFK